MKPKVSVLIATLNSEKVLENCLKSISIQDYPKDQIEIIIADGGSIDNTLQIGQKYGAKIIQNTLKTGESGKMAALNVASGEFVALIDSDNELPTSNWLSQMITPLIENPKAIGSEPWEYTLRPQDGFISRYCALTGVNDPLVLFLGNYDRINTLAGKWTEVPCGQLDFPDYILVELSKSGIPTIGANGTVFRTESLTKYAKGDYLFDIDIISEMINDLGSVKFVKVKNGIIHTFCESDISKFARKQRRRIYDFMFHKKLGTRSYPWNKINKAGYAKFILYCLTVFPLLGQTLLGYMKKRDTAWFFHIIACEITLWEYGVGFLKNLLSPSELNRDKWKQ